MENILTLIGEVIATEVDGVDDINYVRPDSGYKFYVTMKDGTKFMLSLTPES